MVVVTGMFPTKDQALGQDIPTWDLGRDVPGFGCSPGACGTLYARKPWADLSCLGQSLIFVSLTCLSRESQRNAPNSEKCWRASFCMKIRSFEKGVGGQRGLAQGNRSHTINSGIFSAPFFLCPLMSRRTQLWGTFFAVFWALLVTRSPTPSRQPLFETSA